MSWSERKRLGRQLATGEVILQNRSQGNELASAKQLRQPRFHLFDVAIMAQTRFQRSCDSRLLRVDFPRVQVDQDRASVRFHNAASRPSMAPPRQVAKRAPAAGWKIASEYPHGHWRNFAESLQMIDLPTEWETWCARNSVKVVQHRKDAGIVEETFFFENWYSPEGLTNNRERRGTIGGRLFPASICDCRYRTSRIGAKFVRSKPVDSAVEKAVAADLVTGSADLANDRGVALCDPPENKKCPVRVKSPQKFEKPASIVNDAAGEIGPRFRLDLACEGFDLEVIFYVYTQAMQLRFIHMVSIFAILYRLRTRDRGSL